MQHEDSATGEMGDSRNDRKSGTWRENPGGLVTDQEFVSTAGQEAASLTVLDQRNGLAGDQR